jgi:hypothetical protein
MGMSTQNNQQKGTKKAALAMYLYMQNCKWRKRTSVAARKAFNLQIGTLCVE